MISLATAKRVVIKIGTGVLTSGIGDIDCERISTLCKQVASLRERGIEVILVSSGAVGLGMGKLKLEKRPKDVALVQACASLGQSILINTWQQCFNPHEITVAQILLTREDLRAKHRHNAIFNTVERLLSNGIVPIVNENDAISATEIKFGDNDALSALVASVINADMLFILSNIPGLIDMEGTGEVVSQVPKITAEIEAMAQGTTHTTSVGGMISKLSAAKIAHRAGCGVIIGSGKDPDLFQKLLTGQSVGTFFLPSAEPVKPHKRWIAIHDKSYGIITVDQGAAAAIQKAGKSLLVNGIQSYSGDFEAGDIVEIHNPDGTQIARGQPEVSAEKLKNGELKSPVLIHRDYLVLID